MSRHASRRSIARIIAERLSANPGRSAEIVRELAAYLIRYKMVDDADVLMNDIAEELFRQSGHLSVEVTSAHALSDEARTSLTQYLLQSTQAQSVSLHEAVDQSLIGGLVAKTPSAELDVSVRSTLRQLTGLVH